MNTEHLRMHLMLGGLLALLCLGWAWDLATTGGATGGTMPWNLRHDALYLSGLLSIGLMSLAMLLATRPLWLEGPLGGMDRIYRAHKWAGILAAVFAASHWLIKLSSSILKGLYGQSGKVPKLHDGSWQELLRSPAKDMGEWAVYALLAMVLIALWKRFPYRPWRFVHQAMPIIYLMLVFHTLVLAPKAYWTQPIGLLLALLLGAGVYGSLVALGGRIGRARQVQGKVVGIEQPAADILRLECELDEGWPGHHPGQFALLKLDAAEGQHPFTIASADKGDRRISFQIKGLGNYTKGLAQRVRSGQQVQVEGPYGRFLLARHNPKAHQLWIAAGIGITPFLAWLEALASDPQQNQASRVRLHYCTKDAETDPFVAQLQGLCTKLPRIELGIHGSRQGQRLDVHTLAATADTGPDTEVWFCGPEAMGRDIRDGLKTALGSRLSFHQEAFELR